LKERDDGIRCLEQACRTRDARITTILVEPTFDAAPPPAVREEPRRLRVLTAATQRENINRDRE
jgi:hypothetical protein